MSEINLIIEEHKGNWNYSFVYGKLRYSGSNYHTHWGARREGKKRMKKVLGKRIYTYRF